MRKIKKNKISNYKLIGIIYITLILTISTAYSFFNENLSINTNASISQNGENYVTDNTTISKEEVDGIYYYEYSTILTYIQKQPTTGWKIYIEIPFDSEIIECYNAYSCTIEGEVLTIQNNTDNGILSSNSTSTTFNFKFKTSDSNYTFNILGVKFSYGNEQNIPYTLDNPNLPIIKDISGNFSILYDWETTKQYIFTINNNTETTIESWTATIKIPNEFIINTIWSATWNYDETSHILTMSGPEWSPTIPSLSKVEVNINMTTPTQEQPYIIDLIGTSTTGEKFRIDISGGETQ